MIPKICMEGRFYEFGRRSGSSLVEVRVAGRFCYPFFVAKNIYFIFFKRKSSSCR